MKYILRKYQQDAVSQLLDSVGKHGNDVVVVPQGGGKSLIIADFVHKLQKPVIILSPTKEILEQNMDKFLSYVDKSEIGVYSASMDRKDVSTFTFATIQSCYKRPDLFQNFELAIVDECDLVPIKKMSGMYNTFFKKANIKKIIGFTGTPWRMDSFYKEPKEGWQKHWERKRKGWITPLEIVTTTKIITRYPSGFWSRLLYVLNTKDLLEQDYLSPLQYIDRTIINHSGLKLNKNKSEFDLNDYEQKIVDKLEEIVTTIKWAKEKRRHVLVFCTSISQASYFCDLIPDSAVVTSETKKRDRTRIIREFKEGKIRVVFNVSVLTVGFDFPELDCLVLVRPSRSLRLHLQILGRGTRKHENKTSCLVVDLSGNVKSLGKLEEIEIKKIYGMWNVVSPSQPEGFHMKPLYNFTLL